MPSSPTPLSGSANDQAQPELVVASALNPAACSQTAEPASQGLGMTKQPDSCSRRKLARRSAMEAAMANAPCLSGNGSAAIIAALGQGPQPPSMLSLRGSHERRSSSHRILAQGPYPA